MDACLNFLQIFFMCSSLLRRHLFQPPSMVFISVIITQLHVTSVCSFHVLLKSTFLWHVGTYYLNLWTILTVSTLWKIRVYMSWIPFNIFLVQILKTDSSFYALFWIWLWIKDFMIHILDESKITTLIPLSLFSYKDY